MNQGYSPNKGVLREPFHRDRPPDPPPLRKSNIADQAELLLMEIAQNENTPIAERIEACRILMGK